MHAVTSAIFESIRAGIAASCVMARACGASVHAIDVGICPPAPPATAAANAAARVSSGMLSSFLPGGDYATDDEASSSLFANPTPDADRLGAKPRPVLYIPPGLPLKSTFCPETPSGLGDP